MIQSKQTLKIGILGCRGIPNMYGGYEQFAQYLSQGLVQRGHEVYVYCSSLHPYREPTWNGVHLLHLFDPEDRLGTAGQFIYDFNCLRDARRRNFDVLLQLGYTSSAVFFRWWPRNCFNLIHMDGLEWKRTKYNKLVRSFLLAMENWAVEHGDGLIADSTAIQQYLADKYGTKAFYLPYGIESRITARQEDLDRLDLPAGGYVLAIARFVPENNLKMIVEGYLDSGNDNPLVIVGDYDNAFGRKIRRICSGTDNVRLTGGIYDFGVLNSLRTFARVYLHGHSVGGTNPSLLEAMNCRVPICAHDNAFNRAILGGDALYFSNSRQIAELLNGTLHSWRFGEAAEANFTKVRTDFAWPLIVERYEELMLACRERQNR